MNGQICDTSVLELMRRCTDHEDALRIMLINYICSVNITEVIIVYMQIAYADN